MRKVIKTKLYVPEFRTQTVVRNRLYEMLTQSTRMRLTLVIAPAGFGKSTLISSWIHSTKQATAWLSLDAMDAESTRFMLYLIAAIQTCYPKFGHHIMASISDQPNITMTSIMSDMINELTEIDQEITLVLDDYHSLDILEIDQALSFFIDHLPPQIHLIISSRIEPNLPISRWRANDEMQEIRASDLRFTKSETQQYFDMLADVHMNAQQIQLITNRTEGWIAGLQLAGLTLKKVDDTERFVTSFSGSHRYVMDYLTDEVLKYLNDMTITFLLKTSILHELTADLCNFIMDISDAQQQLEMIEEMNLFIVPLDYERKWYRYHHLFSDLLKHRLHNGYSPTVIEQLHRRACQWHETHGLVSNALYHAHIINDYDKAIQLIIDHAPTKMENGESSTVFSWINTFSDDQIRANPFLSIKRGWQLLYRWRLEEIDSYLLSAEKILSSYTSDTTTQNMLAELTAIRISKLRYQQLFKEAIAIGVTTLHQLPDDNTFAHGLILTLLGGAYANQGHTQQAITTYEKALEIIRTTQDFKRIISVTHQLSVLYSESGQLSKGISLLEHALHSQPQTTPAIGGLHSGLGLLRYEQNELESAIFHFRKTIEISQHETFLSQAYVTLSMIFLTQGEISKYEEVFQKAEAIMLRWGASSIHILDGIKARMALLRGDVPSAEQWQQSFDLTIGKRFPFYFEILMFTYIRVLIIQGREQGNNNALDEASNLLTHIENKASSENRIRAVIEAQILHSLVCDGFGKRDQAIKVLEVAINLATPEGYSRVFINEAEPMFKLLQHVPQTPFVTTLVASFPISPTSIVDQSNLVEPLTNRELEILQLISVGYTNAEIAESLVIAVTTVKKHVSNIYGKLFVRNRTEAVKYARELGFID